MERGNEPGEDGILTDLLKNTGEAFHNGFSHIITQNIVYSKVFPIQGARAARCRRLRYKAVCMHRRK